MVLFKGLGTINMKRTIVTFHYRTPKFERGY